MVNDPSTGLELGAVSSNESDVEAITPQRRLLVEIITRLQSKDAVKFKLPRKDASIRFAENEQTFVAVDSADGKTHLSLGASYLDTTDGLHEPYFHLAWLKEATGEVNGEIGQIDFYEAPDPDDEFAEPDQATFEGNVDTLSRFNRVPIEEDWKISGGIGYRLPHSQTKKPVTDQQIDTLSDIVEHGKINSERTSAAIKHYADIFDAEVVPPTPARRGLLKP
jgi:hypothetical protein